MILRTSLGLVVIVHLRNATNPRAGHFVICEDVSPSSVTILDASSGIPAQLSKEFFALWSGKAMLVSEKPIEMKASESRNGFLRFAVWVAIVAVISFVLILGYPHIPLRAGT